MGDQALQAVLSGTRTKANILARGQAAKAGKDERSLANFKAGAEDLGNQMKAFAEMKARQQEGEELTLVREAQSGAVASGADLVAVLGDLQPKMTTRAGRLALGTARLEAAAAAQARKRQDEKDRMDREMHAAKIANLDADTIARSRPKPAKAPAPLSPSAKATAYREAYQRAVPRLRAALEQQNVPEMDARESVQYLGAETINELFEGTGIEGADRERALYEFAESVQKEREEQADIERRAAKVEADEVGQWARSNAPRVATSAFRDYLLAFAENEAQGMSPLDAHREASKQAEVTASEQVSGLGVGEKYKAAILNAAMTDLAEKSNAALKSLLREVSERGDRARTLAEKEHKAALEKKRRKESDRIDKMIERLMDDATFAGEVLNDEFFRDNADEPAVQELLRLLEAQRKLYEVPDRMPESSPATPTQTAVPPAEATAPSSGYRDIEQMTLEEKKAELARLRGER